MAEAACHSSSVPIMEGMLSSGWETKAFRTTQCIHICTPQPALTLPKPQPDQSLLALDLEWVGVSPLWAESIPEPARLRQREPFHCLDCTLC